MLVIVTVDTTMTLTVAQAEKILKTINIDPAGKPIQVVPVKTGDEKALRDYLDPKKITVAVAATTPKVDQSHLKPFHIFMSTAMVAVYTYSLDVSAWIDHDCLIVTLRQKAEATGQRYYINLFHKDKQERQCLLKIKKLEQAYAIQIGDGDIYQIVSVIEGIVTLALIGYRSGGKHHQRTLEWLLTQPFKTFKLTQTFNTEESPT